MVVLRSVNVSEEESWEKAAGLYYVGAGVGVLWSSSWCGGE